MEHIDVFRLSASRPWQLRDTSPICKELIKYSGELKWHLIESVLVQELSNECVEYAKSIGYVTHVINPAQGQGYAIDYALKHAVTSKYTLKWEDDFKPEMEIPIDTCVKLMDKYPHINQICFNKRETMSKKGWNGKDFMKEQRYFELDGEQIPLVVKEKWWFGTALWRSSFIKPIFRYWPTNTHNHFNFQVLIPKTGWRGGHPIPTPQKIEEVIGCYIYGKTGDKRMVFHAGINDSIWSGELQKKWKAEGRTIIGS